MRQQDRAKDRSRDDSILFVVGSTELGSRVLFCAAAKPARRVVNSKVMVSMMNEVMKLGGWCDAREELGSVNECQELYRMTMRRVATAGEWGWMGV